MVSTPGGGLSHGNNGAKLMYAVEAGMTPLQAIEAATATSPETLGPQAPLSGQIKEGYDADFIVVDGNPLKDITLLNKPDRITHVWKGEICTSSPVPSTTFSKIIPLPIRICCTR